MRTLLLFHFQLPEKLLLPFCSAYISSLPCLYFLLFCPPIFLAGPNWGSQRGYISLSGRRREGGYTSLSNYPLPNKCLTSRPPSPPPPTVHIFILETGYLGGEAFAYQIRKLNFEFYFDLKRKAPGLNSIRREILAAGNFHFELGNCRGAKLRQYSKWSPSRD